MRATRGLRGRREGRTGSAPGRAVQKTTLRRSRTRRASCQSGGSGRCACAAFGGGHSGSGRSGSTSHRARRRVRRGAEVTHLVDDARRREAERDRDADKAVDGPVARRARPGSASGAQRASSAQGSERHGRECVLERAVGEEEERVDAARLGGGECGVGAEGGRRRRAVGVGLGWDEEAGDARVPVAAAAELQGGEPMRGVQEDREGEREEGRQCRRRSTACQGNGRRTLSSSATRWPSDQASQRRA